MHPHGKEDEIKRAPNHAPTPYTQPDSHSAGYLASELEELTKGVERVELEPYVGDEAPTASQNASDDKRTWASNMWRVNDVVECVELEIVGGPEKEKRAKAQYPAGSEASTIKDRTNSLDEIEKPSVKLGAEEGQRLILDKIRKLEENYMTGLEMARELGDALENYYASRLNRLREFRKDFTG